MIKIKINFNYTIIFRRVNYENKTISRQSSNKKVEAEEKTASGIILPGSAKEQPQMAEVIEVGPGGIVDGNEIKMEVKSWR